MKTNAKIRAFTRAELFALITAISLCLIVSFNVVGSDQRSSKTTLCLNNLKQLTAAWLLYAADNDGRLVENYQGSGALGGAAGNQGKAPWASGWIDWTTSSDNTNQNLLFLQKYARLGPYFTATNIHKCPEDIFVSPAQQNRRFAARSRSVVLSVCLGDGNAEAGPWDTTYTQVKLLSQLVNPAPGETFAFLDEHPSSINDPVLFPPTRQSWIDMPGSYHENGGSFSFADGHVELHKWRATAQPQNVPVTLQDGGFHLKSQPRLGDPDISWVSSHSPRASTNHY